MTSQVFIASYHKDIEWLRCCLLTLKKYSVGFLPPVVGVSEREGPMFRAFADQIWPEVTIAADGKDSWMAAQSRMMAADLYCPEADIIFLLGSDCMVASEFRPEPFMRNGLPVMLYNTYDHLIPHAPGVAPWKAGTERVLGFPVAGEFMRRIPTLAPREIYAPMRAHVERIHAMKFNDYIEYGEAHGGGTSETNILGAFAWEFMRDRFDWVNLDHRYDEEMKNWPNPVLQFWSKHRAGLDWICDRDMRYGNKTTLGKTAREVFGEVWGNG